MNFVAYFRSVAPKFFHRTEVEDEMEAEQGGFGRRTGTSAAIVSVWIGGGLVVGVLASKVLALIVYQATPRDPVVLAGVVLAMALLGLMATWVPAQRALSLDPMSLLREE
ncbi:MAG TPA: hypothetical protein VMF91_15810 [Bryobacteraceae bacterium]|nr:hypothetical protein [Bryobacteraceae bacterium]